MSERRSTLYVTTLLHHYSIAEPHPMSGIPVFEQVRGSLVGDGLLEEDFTPNSSGFKPTPRGAAFIKLILGMPLPVEVQAFENPMTGDLIQ